MAWMKEGIVAGDMKLEDGWLFTTKTGIYGTDYRQRALVTAIGLGANRPQDAVYPTSEGPDVLKPYNGANKYVMHFNKGELPPVDGFWSLTMYDANYFFVPNPLNRYTVSQRNKLKTNAGRLGRSVHPERIARQGQGAELAARAEGQVHPDDAALLAEGEAAVTPRRQLEDPRRSRKSARRRRRNRLDRPPARLVLAVFFAPALRPYGCRKISTVSLFPGPTTTVRSSVFMPGRETVIVCCPGGTCMPLARVESSSPVPAKLSLR